MSEENPADMIDCDAQLLEMFVSNAADLLDQIEADLLSLEHMGEEWDDELVNKVFRSAHTIKGESGFVGLEVIGKLAHSIENVLDKIRDRVFEADHETINLLLECFDELRRLTEDVENSNDEDVSDFTSRLELLLDHKMNGESEQPADETDAEPIAQQPETPMADECKMKTKTTASEPDRPKGKLKELPGDVLIVDDDPMIRNLVQHHLEKNNITSQTADSCEQCLKKVRNQSYRVIVLDFELPDGEGIEIIREIKNTLPLAQIIMLTGEVNMYNVVGCLEAGAIDFLPKTSDYKLIVDPILSALERSKRWKTLLNGKRQAVPV